MKILTLRTGDMTSQEIALWLGLGYDTYRQNIAQYLKRLTYYCTFTRTSTGINISSINCSNYLGELKQSDLNIMKAYISQQKKIQMRDYPIISVQKVKKDLRIYYPDYTKEEVDIRAQQLLTICGTSKNDWGIYKEDTNECRLLTEEEKTILSDIIDKMEETSSMKNKRRTAIMLTYHLKIGLLTKTEYAEKYSALFENYIPELTNKFKEKTGKILENCWIYQLKEPLNKSILTGT